MWFYVQMLFPLLTIALTAAICLSVVSFIMGQAKPQRVNRVALGSGSWSPFRIRAQWRICHSPPYLLSEERIGRLSGCAKSLR
jgi:hypothetical protein